MHHPTDVLGAAILTACWITLLWWTVRPNADLSRPVPTRTFTDEVAPAAAEESDPVPVSKA
jgi:membrane-associated phospholipid phosphatase